jgi:hypothetical protein
MRITHRSLLALVGAVSAAATMPAGAQVRTLPAPDATYDEPFSSIPVGGVRELRNGKLVVADPRDKTLQMIDLAGGEALKIGREGSGPAEWGLPFRLFTAPNDSTYMFDPGNTRYFTILPDGKPGSTWRMAESGAQAAGDGPAGPVQIVRPGATPPAGAQPPAGQPRTGQPPAGQPPAGQARPGQPSDGRRVVTGGGPTARLGASLAFARTSDAQGRLYYEAPAFSFGPNGPTSADSTAIMRYDRVAQKADTIGHVKLAKNNVQTSGGQGNFSFRVGGANPLAARDEWAVFPDGRVAIVRAADYHIDWIMPNGSRVTGPAVRYTPIKMTAADIKEEEALRARANSGALRMSVTADGGGPQRTSVGVGGPSGPPPEPLTDWPSVKPPFRPGQASVWARPNGELWVRRMEPAGANGTLYDVFNAQGGMSHQVRVADGLSIVGMGNGTIYTVKLDEDDLQYLQRHRMQ